MTEQDNLNVLCFGEALWDRFPSGRHIGGAPVNVAYHLSRLGCVAWPVTAVGDDELGHEMLATLAAWGLRCELIGMHTDKPTGIVDVTLNNGSPSYDIVEEVAWDYVDVPAALPDRCFPVDAIVFGSLAQRTAHNRDSLGRLLDLLPGALKVFDVNMRPPYDAPERIRALMQRADLIKLNDDEARILSGQSSDTADPETIAREIAAQTSCDRICVTAGASGAGLLETDRWIWVDSDPVEVRDTVGAGDSFLAALVHGLLAAPDRPARTLARASRLAGFVAGSDGATPEYVFEDLP